MRGNFCWVWSTVATLLAQGAWLGFPAGKQDPGDARHLVGQGHGGAVHASALDQLLGGVINLCWQQIELPSLVAYQLSALDTAADLRNHL